MVDLWVLINQPIIPQKPQNLTAQIVCPSPKTWDFDEKRLHWASVVRGLEDLDPKTNYERMPTTIQIWHL